MSYLTLEVQIDHGRIVPAEPERLPEKGRGLLTVLEPAQAAEAPPQMTRLEAFKALQKSLNLDEAKASAWMDMIREGRR